MIRIALFVDRINRRESGVAQIRDCVSCPCNAQTTTPTSTTILYAYDTSDHIIAELNTSGQTLREYIWLNDMPVAVVDNVNTTPVIYYVQVDHLMRPARMTNQSAVWVWDVIFTPFGTTAYVNQNPTVMNIRFPGHGFSLRRGWLTTGIGIMTPRPGGMSNRTHSSMMMESFRSGGLRLGSRTRRNRAPAM